MAETEYERTQKRWTALQADRSPLEPEIRDIADNFAPARTKLVTIGGNGSAQNSAAARRARFARVINNRPLIAARTCAAGMHAGLTSPARPWCKLSTPADPDLAEFGPNKSWLDLVEKKLLATWAKSNLYTALPYCYLEQSTFATMAMLGLEHPKTLLHFEHYTFGEYWIACDADGRADTLYRLLPYTLRQAASRFGEKALPGTLRDKLDRCRYEDTVRVLCAIEPNLEPAADSPFAEGKAWKSVYWAIDCDDGRTQPLQRTGFESNPILSAVWERNNGESYGSSCPGMIALGAARALQKNMLDKARAIQRSHNPPMQAPTEMARAGVSVLPGAMNYLPPGGVGQGIKSLYDFQPDIRGLLDDIREGEHDVGEAYYYDLFLMLSNDERAQRATAEEIRAQYEEKVLALGPTLEMNNGNLLTPLVNRSFDILVRRSRPYWEGKLHGEPDVPPPPKSLAGVDLSVDFIGVLQQAQRAASLGAMERFMSGAVNLAKAKPDILDKLDFDQYVDEMGTGLAVPAGLVRPDDAVQEIRQGREQQQNAQQLASMAPAMKDVAGAVSTLAGTQPAPDNVLSAMAGNAAPV